MDHGKADADAVAVLGPDPVAGMFDSPVAHPLGVRAAGVRTDVLAQPLALARPVAGAAAQGFGAVTLFLRMLRQWREPVAATSAFSGSDPSAAGILHRPALLAKLRRCGREGKELCQDERDSY